MLHKLWFCLYNVGNYIIVYYLLIIFSNKKQRLKILRILKEFKK